MCQNDDFAEFKILRNEFRKVDFFHFLNFAIKNQVSNAWLLGDVQICQRSLFGLEKVDSGIRGF
jgi:hypothetical protein